MTTHSTALALSSPDVRTELLPLRHRRHKLGKTKKLIPNPISGFRGVKQLTHNPKTSQDLSLDKNIQSINLFLGENKTKQNKTKQLPKHRAKQIPNVLT